MKKRTIVMSLGGSLIAEEKINLKFLQEFREIIQKNSNENNFIIVCGGGKTARKYIEALNKNNSQKDLQNFIGIACTRLNARFMSYVFGFDQKKGVPRTTRTLKKYLKQRGIVFCGALEYKPEQTSDSTAAEIARKYKTYLINITDVDGLYDKDPRKNPGSKLIKRISWKEFHKKAYEIGFKPGQNFVLDQTAAKIILENKIPTYITGKNLKQIDKIINNKKDFRGTLINR